MTGRSGNNASPTPSPYRYPLNHKQRKTLYMIFIKPEPSNITWRQVENLLFALGAYIENGSGSRVLVRLNLRKGRFHKPHPGKEIDQPIVRNLRSFLISAEITP